MNHIPKHVIDAPNKRRQRRVYFRMLQRAGFQEEENLLSCIEPESITELSLDEPADYRLGSASSKSKECQHNQLSDPTSKSWLGPASKSLLSSIESSRLYDIFARPIKRESESTQNNDSTERPVTRKMPDFFQSERMDNTQTLAIVNGSLSQSLFKTTISDGFGKLVYPNGEVYIGMWHNDIPHGHGKALYKGGASYEGDWNNGNRQGRGKMTFVDGSYYEGGFQHRFHGEGTFTSDNFVYTGSFSNGNVYGEYSVTFDDGEILQRSWPNARLTLHEAINKLVKEREARKYQMRRRSKVLTSVSTCVEERECNGDEETSKRQECSSP